MEKMLEEFQNGLGDVGETIKVLEEQAFIENVQLKNRRNTTKQLSSLVNDLNIPQELLK